MNRAAAIVVLGVLCAWSGAQPETADGLLGILQQASPPARAAASRLIAERYPQLPNDIVTLIEQERPGFLMEIQPDLDRLVAQRYPDLEQYAEAALAQTPGVQAAIEGLLAEKYPTAVTEIAALPPGPDLPARATELVRTKYPGLWSDVLSLLRTQHPELLGAIQVKIQAQYPTIIADVGQIVLSKYPELTDKVMGMVVAKYPTLMGELHAALRTTARMSLPTADTPGGPVVPLAVPAAPSIALTPMAPSPPAASPSASVAPSPPADAPPRTQ